MRSSIRAAAWLVSVACLAVGLGACGKPAEKPAGRSRDKRGATPLETVALVKEALERRRYRDVLSHVFPDDQALFALGRLQSMIAFTEGLETHDSERRRLLEKGLAGLRKQFGLTDEELRLAHESALDGADLGSLMDGLGALGATTSVDGLGGFADLVPILRDVTIEGDTASAYAGEPDAPERWVFRKHEGAWYYAARE